MKRSSI